MKMSNQDMAPDLEAKLKACDLEIQHYVKALESENLNHQKKIAKLQATTLSLRNQIKVFEDKSSYCPECEERLIKEAEEEAGKYSKLE